MKRLFLFAFSATALVLSLATVASAETPRAQSESIEKSTQARVERPRYTSTLERWRGRPQLRSASTSHPAEVTGGERVYEHLPSVNFLLEGQSGGAFSPSFGAGSLGAGF
jgi:hypothetical protein